jgi:hypothetical protein
MDVSIAFPVEAQTHFDETASRLLAALKPCAPRIPPEPLKGSLGEKPKMFHLNSSNIIGPIEVTFTDGFDEFCGFEVHSHNVHEAILGEDATRLEQLADKIANRKDLRSLCGTAYVRKHLMGWIRRRRFEEKAEASWCSDLLLALRGDVSDCILLVPLDGIEIAVPFDFGGVHFDCFKESQFDRMLAAVQSQGDALKGHVAKLRKEYQGRVYAEYRCRAVQEYAEELALHHTDRVLDILKMFDAAALEIRAQCHVGRLGQVIPARTYVFRVTDESCLLLSQGTDRPIWKDLGISQEFLRFMKDTGIAIAAELVQKDNLTNLEERALEAVSHYAHGVAAVAPQDRLVHALVAVESLLVRNDSEPIQSKLAPRVARLTKSGLEARKEAIRDLTEGYRLRSAFVHHGVRPDDVQTTNRLLRLCWETVNSVLFNTRKFTSRDLLLNRLDDESLS